MNGHYIVLEGIDGSGKTTTCLAVAEILSQEGYKVLLLSEPSHSEIGLFLRKQMISSGIVLLILCSTEQMKTCARLKLPNLPCSFIPLFPPSAWAMTLSRR